ncbi:MAG TPA: hypothetical protein VLC51_11590, partial [Nitrospira sp.]|nr:hypothetical protein [Nitrospira sp.]
MALALSGGINVWGEFPGDTRNHVVEGITTFLLQAGWKLDQKVPAASTAVPFGGSNPSNGQTFTVSGFIYTFKNTLTATPREVKIGANLSATLLNLVGAINLGSSGPQSGTAYSTTTLANPLVKASSQGTSLTITFKFAGTVGNGTPCTLGALKGGGYRVRALSPQMTWSDATTPLQAQGYMYDDGGATAKFAMLSVKDSSVATAVKQLPIVAGRRYRIVANRCQFFVYVPGLDNLGNPGFTGQASTATVLSAGIPWVPPPGTCSGEMTGAPANEVFTAIQDASLISSPRTTIVGSGRLTETAPDTTGTISPNMETTPGMTFADAVFNGQIVPGGRHLSEFRMCSLYPGAQLGKLNSCLWVGEKYQELEPLFAWAPVNGQNPVFVG